MIQSDSDDDDSQAVQISDKGLDEPSDERPVSRNSQRSSSPTTTKSESTRQNEIEKELIKLIPRYDGTGGVQKLLEYVENFQRYADSVPDVSDQLQLTLAVAKFTGDASLWW